MRMSSGFSHRAASDWILRLKDAGDCSVGYGRRILFLMSFLHRRFRMSNEVLRFRALHVSEKKYLQFDTLWSMGVFIRHAGDG